jgi:hypothetical protein
MRESYQHADAAGMLSVLEPAESRSKLQRPDIELAQANTSDFHTICYGGCFTFSANVTSLSVMHRFQITTAWCRGLLPIEAAVS